MSNAPSSLPLYVQYLQALGPITITIVFGIFASLIAFNQWKTAKNKLNFDLFDKRFLVWQKCRQFSVAIVQKRDFNYEILPDFYDAMGQAQFLFDEDVNGFLKEMKERAFRLKNLIMEIYDSNGQAIDHPDRSRVAGDIGKECIWFSEYYEKSAKVFSPYLSMKGIRATSYKNMIN